MDEEVNADTDSEASYSSQSDSSDEGDEPTELFSTSEQNILDAILAQSSSSDGEEFGGFTDEGYINLPNPRPDNEDFIDNWVEGSRPRVDLPFTAPVGLRQFIDLEDDAEPIDYFNLFFDEQHYDTMATETNRYADQYFSANREQMKAGSRFHKWVPTNASEMKLFLSMVIAMGLVILGDINEYWSTNDVTQTPWFPECMPRDRFWLLMTFFHLSNNRNVAGRGTAGYSPLVKLGNIYQNIIGRFSSVYRPHQQISLDEGTVPWRGNLRFRVYNPNKPKKYGMKAYMLCDSTNGYCFKFRLYTGKTETRPSEHGLIYDLVMDLLKDYRGKGYHLFMDNYYSSPTLYVNLWQMGIGATGTLRANRKGTHKNFQKKKLPKGGTYVMHNENLLGLRFRDRKYVTMLSTVETEEMVSTGKQNRVTQEEIMKPSIVVEYDKYMGGVDRMDQMCSYTPFRNKTMKWWKRLFFHVINMMIANAYVIYKSHSQVLKLKTARKFKQSIIMAMNASVDGKYMPCHRERVRGRTPYVAKQNRLHGRHFPKKAVAVGQKKNISRVCVVCSAVEKNKGKGKGKGKGGKKRAYPSESSYACDKCGVSLCIHPCFKLYHINDDFVRAFNLLKMK